MKNKVRYRVPGFSTDIDDVISTQSYNEIVVYMYGNCLTPIDPRQLQHILPHWKQSLQSFTVTVPRRTAT